MVVTRRWAAKNVSGKFGVSYSGLRQAIKRGKGDMDDDPMTRRRTNIVRVARGHMLPPPPVVVTAQEEGKENMGKHQRTHRGTKDVDDDDCRDGGPSPSSSSRQKITTHARYHRTIFFHISV